MAGLLLAAALAAAQPLPPYAAAYAPATLDERGLWRASDEQERVLRDSPSVVRDPALTAYVRGVLCRTVGAERCGATRLYVARVPAFNAMMAPNGAMIVWTGLLLRVRSEAELAAVLGHEFAHFELRHSLDGYKRARSATDALAWTGLLTPAAGTLSLTLVGMHYAHARADETAADLLGLRYMRAAGYRPLAAPRLWERLMAEQDETALARGRTAKRRQAAGFLASHPTEAARADYLRRAAGADGAVGEEGEATFQAALAPWRARLIADQIKLNDFGGSEYLLSQLAAGGWTPELLLARAELHRERGAPRELASAAGLYRQAIDAGSVDPAAWRGLGLALLRGGRAEEGRAALATYLAKAPDAPDRAAMALLIGEGPAR